MSRHVTFPAKQNDGKTQLDRTDFGVRSWSLWSAESGSDVHGRGGTGVPLLWDFQICPMRHAGKSTQSLDDATSMSSLSFTLRRSLSTIVWRCIFTSTKCYASIPPVTPVPIIIKAPQFQTCDIDKVLTPITFYSKLSFLGWIVLFFGPLDFEFCFGRARITLSFSFLLHGLSDPEQIHGDVGTVVEGLIFCHYDWIASFRQPLYTYSSRLVVTRDIRGGLK